MPTRWRRMNTILTDIRALSTISSTFTGLVRRGAHIDKIIDCWGKVYKFRVNGHLFVKVKTFGGKSITFVGPLSVEKA